MFAIKVYPLEGFQNPPGLNNLRACETTHSTPESVQCGYISVHKLTGNRETDLMVV